MRGDDLRARHLLNEALTRGYTRREILRRGAALGLSMPLIAGIIAACGGDDSATKTTTGGSGSPAASGGTVHVSIVNKDMTQDELTAAIKKEGTVVVGNWTYTANDQLIAQFQKYVKDTY